jgi:hypothetical protein
VTLLLLSAARRQWMRAGDDDGGLSLGAVQSASRRCLLDLLPMGSLHRYTTNAW